MNWARLDSKAVELYYEKFATSTVIRVFNFIRNASFLIERLFWIAILIGFSSLTIWSVSQTFDRYFAELTISEITYKSNRTSGFSFLNATFCLPIDSPKLMKMYGSDEMVDQLIRNISKISNINEHLKARLDSIHSMEDNRLAKLNFTKGWSIAQHYYFSENEIALLGLTTIMFSHMTQFETKPINAITAVLKGPADKLLEFYRSKKTDFSELIKLTAEMSCLAIQLRILHTRHDLNTGVEEKLMENLCRRDYFRYFWFGHRIFSMKAMMCYAWTDEKSPFLFASISDNVMITFEVETIYETAEVDSNFILINFMNDMSLDKQASVVGRIGQRQMIYFNIENELVLANLRRRPCASIASRQGNQIDCFEWCAVENILHACKCLPIHLNSIPKFGPVPNYPDCWAQNFSTSPQCKKALTKNASPTNCSQACIDNCEINLFSSFAANDYSLFLSLNVSTVLGLKPFRLIYQLVTERKAMDAMMLVAALGGNLSLYLGASFLALIHIVVFFLKVPFDILGKQKSSPAMAKTEAAASKSGRENENSEMNRHSRQIEELVRHVKKLDKRLESIDLERKMLRGALLLRCKCLP